MNFAELAGKPLRYTVRDAPADTGWCVALGRGEWSTREIWRELWDVLQELVWDEVFLAIWSMFRAEVQRLQRGGEYGPATKRFQRGATSLVI